MDAKITLAFDAELIKSAKAFAESQNMSLSRLTEFLYAQIAKGNYKGLEELPIADWVQLVAEGEAEYHTKSRGRKSMKETYREGRK